MRCIGEGEGEASKRGRLDAWSCGSGFGLTFLDTASPSRQVCKREEIRKAVVSLGVLQRLREDKRKVASETGAEVEAGTEEVASESVMDGPRTGDMFRNILFSLRQSMGRHAEYAEGFEGRESCLSDCNSDTLGAEQSRLERVRRRVVLMY